LYKFKIATFKNQTPSLAKEISQKTLPSIAEVIPLEIKPLKKGSVKIIFRPHPNERVQGYTIQRYDDKSSKWRALKDIEPRYNVEYIDSRFKRREDL